MAENPQPQPKLIPRANYEGVKEFYELGDSTTVGRHPTNNIVLGLDSVSRFHGRVDKRGKFFIVQDLNSSNGTFVNGERVTQMTLHHNDVVTFGAIEFLYEHEGTSSGITSSGSGMSIVDIRDDRAEPSRPTTQSIISSEQIKEKSSVFSALTDKKADRQTLMKLNNRISTLYRLSELLRESAWDREDVVLQRGMDLLFEAVEADRGVIMTRCAPEATDLEVVAVKYRDEPISPSTVQISRTILDQVVGNRVAVLSRDTMTDERFGQSESIIMNQIRSAICVPMIHAGKVMGVIHLDTSSSTRLFNKDDLEFVTTFTTELSVALENNRMRKESVHRERLAAVGETVAGISHNAKNILLLMKGGSDLLNRAMEKKDMEAACESWGVVNRGIDKISKLVRDMLEYSSNRRPRLIPIDVNKMICGIAEEIEDELINKGITLELDLEEELDERLLDEVGVQRTLMNLIVNAIEAISHPEGRVTITTALRGENNETLVVTVSDNGSGIPRDKLEKVFLPFFTTKGSSGTGLGLPMCKKCVEDLGGTMRVESEEQVGTTFTITLPRRQEETISEEDLVRN